MTLNEHQVKNAMSVAQLEAAKHIHLISVENIEDGNKDVPEFYDRGVKELTRLRESREMFCSLILALRLAKGKMPYKCSNKVRYLSSEYVLIRNK